MKSRAKVGYDGRALANFTIMARGAFHDLLIVQVICTSSESCLSNLMYIHQRLLYQDHVARSGVRRPARLLTDVAEW
jgi:hypothetical protein